MATGWRSRIDDLQFPLNDGGGASSAYSSVALQPTAGDESGSAAAAAGKPERSRSLDAFRGAVIVLMIFVDDAGGTYGGHIDHSPWDVIHLADFVMPLFLFIVGVAMVMAQRSQNKPGTRLSLFATNAWRCTKLFLIGLYVQGGKNLTMLRVPGILQRIAFAQIVTAAIEIGVPERDTRDSVGFEDQSYWRLYKRHAYRWLACMAVVMLYCGLLYGTNTGLPGCSTGETTPACNAAYYWDNELLGVNHMYRSPTYRRLPACDPCGNATRTTQPLPVDCPAWCVRPFDPEGSLASFAAVFSLYVGAFVGHIWLATPGEDFAAERVRQAAPLGAALVVLGFLLQFAGIPMNKNLFSLSYIFFMAGAATLFLLLFWCVPN